MFKIRSGTVEVNASNLAEVIGILNDRDFHKLAVTDLTVNYTDGPSLSTVSNRYGAIGIPLAGEHDQTLLALLEQALVPAFKDGKPLAPWQMRRTDWLALVAIGKLAYDVIPGLDKSLPACRYEVEYPSGVRSVSLSDWIDSQFYAKLGYGHNGPNYKRTGQGATNSRHEVHVAYALADGFPVEQAVIDDMLKEIGTGSLDLGFARAVAERPFLRGRISVDKLDTLISVYERHGKMKITQEIAPVIFEIMSQTSMGEDPTYTAVDDALYLNGLLPPLPPKSDLLPITINPVQPSGPATTELIAHLNRAQRQVQLDRLAGELQNGRIAKRFYEQEVAYYRVALLARTEHANRVVQSIESRDIAALLNYFDIPDDRNVVSKRFMREHFGLNVLNLKAAGRRSAIFRFCGLDSVMQCAWEAKHIEARLARLAASDAENERESATSLASQNTVKDENNVVSTWKELIDRRIANGFTEIRRYKQGAIMKSYLYSAEGNRLMQLQRKDGSMAYAEVALKDRLAAINKAASEVAENEESDQAGQGQREVQRG